MEVDGVGTNSSGIGLRANWPPDRPQHEKQQQAPRLVKEVINDLSVGKACQANPSEGERGESVQEIHPADVMRVKP